MDTLPPFFKEYMEQKFNELHQKIDSVFDAHDAELADIRKELDEVKQDTRWNNQKIWMGLGALGVLGVTGGILAMYFKEVNKTQVNEAVKEAIDPIKTNVDKLQNTLSQYDIKVEN